MPRNPEPQDDAVEKGGLKCQLAILFTLGTGITPFLET